MDQSLAEKAYQFIREQLSCGELQPGNRLVNRKLAEAIGVSVIPVREAINRLASEGLIEHVPGTGAFVRKPSRQDLDDLYVLRDALESCAASEAARYITESQLGELQIVLERFKDTAEQIQKQPKRHSNKRLQSRWLNDEKLFHELLVESSRNGILARVIRDNLAIVSVFEAQRRCDPSFLTYDIASETCVSKNKLLDALRDRDPERARKEMSTQIQRGRQVVVGYMSRQA